MFLNTSQQTLHCLGRNASPVTRHFHSRIHTIQTIQSFQSHRNHRNYYSLSLHQSFNFTHQKQPLKFNSNPGFHQNNFQGVPESRTILKMTMQVPKNILITGANSGLGLEMVKQLLKLEPNLIFATYRNLSRSKELEELSKADPRVRLIQLDMRQDCIYCSALKQVFEATKEDGLNLLINNAGIFTERQTLCEVDKKTFLDFLEVNTVAPVLLTKELLPLLVKASEKNEGAPMGIGRAAVINISSSYGSISNNDEGNYYLSRCCRSALNAASKNLSVDLKGKKILVAAMSPGWVRTQQGGPDAPLSVEESISGIVTVLQNLDDSKTGSFLDYAGKEIPW